MRTRIFGAVAAAAGVLALVGPTASRAIIKRHDREDALYRDLGERYRPYLVQLAVADKEGVPSLYNGMGTLIAPDWVLTAAHAAWLIPGAPGGPRPAAPHHVYVNGKGYRVAEVVFPDLPMGMFGKPYARNDIALVRLAKPVENGQTACLYRVADEIGQVVTLPGVGLVGDGLSGAKGGRQDGALRAAMQRVDGVGDGSDPNVIWYWFDRPGGKGVLELEGIAGPGDSGGPAFVEQDGRLCVIGVSSGQDKRGGPEGLYGVKEFYTRVSSFVPWIEQVIRSRAGSATR